MKSYLVYLHRRATDGKVFYVGKGDIKRANRTTTRSDYWNRIVAKHGFFVEIYLDGIQEWYAFELEKELIAYYGRENLCNLTDGGEGTSGRVPSIDSRIKCSVSNAGKAPCETTIKKAIIKNSKKIIDDEGNIYSSITEASKKIFANGKCSSIISAKTTISACLNGKSNFAYGHMYFYLENGIKYKKEYTKTTVCKLVKNNTGITFKSSIEAQKWLRDNGHEKAIASNITQSCRSKTKTAYGYKWEYA